MVKLTKEWIKVRSNPDRDYVFTYSIRHPDKDDLEKWELVINQNDYYYEQDLFDNGRHRLIIREINGNSRGIIFTWKKPQGVAGHNSVWFIGKTAEEHYDEAINILIADKVRVLDDVEKRYISTKAITSSALKYLNSIKNN